METQSSRYANSQFKWVKREYKVRFAYEATGELVRFTDYADLKYRSREVFSFHRPETLKRWLAEPDVRTVVLSVCGTAFCACGEVEGSWIRPEK